MERYGPVVQLSINCRFVVDFAVGYSLLYKKSTTKSQIPLRYLMADRSEAGRRPAASRNLAYHLAR